MEPLTYEMILVMAMISIAILLFIFEWIRVDVVAILMMVTLPLLHLITPKEAFIGLSSNAVVSIIAVIIIGAGLDKTGLINRLVGPIVRIAGKSQSRVVIAISLTVAIISSFMQNIGAAALFLPAIQRVSKSLKLPISSLLMPIGFSAILGGTVTLVGSSPLILLNDLMEPFGLKPFGLFDVTPIGLALVGSGIACFVFFGRFILPKGERVKDEDRIKSATNDKTLFTLNEAYELRTPADFTHYRDPITVGDLRKKYLVNIVAITEPQAFKVFSHGQEPQAFKVFSPGEEVQTLSNMDLAVFGPEENVRRMAEGEGLILKDTIEVFKEDIADTSSGIVEAVLAPRSPLEGKTLNQINLQERFNVTPIAIYRQGETYLAETGDIKLELGDSILLYSSWHNLMVLHDEKTLLFSTPKDLELIRPEKALFAGLWLAIALVMIMIFKIQLSISLMTGALGMIITRVLSIDEAYKSVDWRTIFLLAGLIPLGVATEKTGAAAWIAHTVLNTIGTVPPIVLMLVIGVLSTIFTLVISNVGATVLLVPLVVNMAIAAHADPRMAALVVGLATSNSFVLPTHQVNALYMGPGRYRSVDFMKAGLVISVVFIVVMISMIYLLQGT